MTPRSQHQRSSQIWKRRAINQDRYFRVTPSNGDFASVRFPESVQSFGTDSHPENNNQAEHSRPWVSGESNWCLWGIHGDGGVSQKSCGSDCAALLSFVRLTGNCVQTMSEQRDSHGQLWTMQHVYGVQGLPLVNYKFKN